VVPENINTTSTEWICPMTPIPSGFPEIGPQSLPPSLLEFRKNFPYPLEILLSLIEGHR